MLLQSCQLAFCAFPRKSIKIEQDIRIDEDEPFFWSPAPRHFCLLGHLSLWVARHMSEKKCLSGTAHKHRPSHRTNSDHVDLSATSAARRKFKAVGGNAAPQLE